MNTLPKEVREQFFQSREHYLAFRKAWAERMKKTEASVKVCRVRDPNHTGQGKGPYHKEKREIVRGVSLDTMYHMLYAMLRGRDWRKGYVMIEADGGSAVAQHAYRLIQGRHWHHLRDLTDVFDEHVTEAMLEKLADHLPEWKGRDPKMLPEAYKTPLPVSTAPAAPAEAS